MYICFVGVKHGLLNGCRPFIGVNGAFERTNGGVLLIVIGVDANNCIFSVTYTITNIENKDS